MIYFRPAPPSTPTLLYLHPWPTPPPSALSSPSILPSSLLCFFLSIHQTRTLSPHVYVRVCVSYNAWNHKHMWKVALQSNSRRMYVCLSQKTMMFIGFNSDLFSVHLYTHIYGAAVKKRNMVSHQLTHSTSVPYENMLWNLLCFMRLKMICRQPFIVQNVHNSVLCALVVVDLPNISTSRCTTAHSGAAWWLIG